MIVRSIAKILLLDCLSNIYAAPYPTIAENRVYDTKLENITASLLEASSGEVKPYIGIYPASTKVLETALNNDSLNSTFEATFHIEMGVFSLSEVTPRLENGDLDPENPPYIVTTNDAQSALNMDLLEQQVYDTLFLSGSAATQRLKKFVVGGMVWSSEQQYSDSVSLKSFIRTATIDIKCGMTFEEPTIDSCDVSFLDRFGEYKDLLERPEYAQIIANAQKIQCHLPLDKIRTDIDSSLGDVEGTITTKEVDLNE